MNENREIAYRIFCPSCLTPSEKQTIRGGQNASHTLHCENCERDFVVNVHIAPTGLFCTTTPPAIRKPEILEDNSPAPLP